MKCYYALSVLLSAFACILNAQSVTHKEACGRFWKAVVPITTDRELGTGFIVSSDGWIVTAAHIVIDSDTKQADKNIHVTLPGTGTPVTARLVSANDDYTRTHDFAFLKVDGKDLPFLTLGDENNLPIGSNLTIVGFPFSATQRVPVKFCLSATVASWYNNPTPIGRFNLVFFQGPSIKGVSGSPVIADDTGIVIGIADASLAGITRALREQKNKSQAFSQAGGQITAGGVNYVDTITEILGVLDDQLVNGLGVAIGAKDMPGKLDEVQKQDAANTAK